MGFADDLYYYPADVDYTDKFGRDCWVWSHYLDYMPDYELLITPDAAPGGEPLQGGAGSTLADAPLAQHPVPVRAVYNGVPTAAVPVSDYLTEENLRFGGLELSREVYLYYEDAYGEHRPDMAERLSHLQEVDPWFAGLQRVRAITHLLLYVSCGLDTVVCSGRYPSAASTSMTAVFVCIAASIVQPRRTPAHTNIMHVAA